MEASVYSKDVITLLKDMDFSAEQFSFLGCYSEIV